MTPQTRLLSEKSIQSLIAKCKEALAIYDAKRLLYEDQLHPDSAAQRIRRDMAKAGSIEETFRLQATLAKFLSEDAKIVARNLHYLIVKDFDSAKVLLNDLISESLRLLTSYKQAALKAEREFFAEHDLPHEVTSVSRQFNIALRELEHAMESLQPQRHPAGYVERMPDARGTVLQWFGISDIV